MIDLTQYQADIRRFYTPEVAANLLEYSRAALVAEVGEVVGLRAKRMRGDARYQDATAYREAVVLEMGDVLFSYVSIWTANNVLADFAFMPTPEPTLEAINRHIDEILRCNAPKVVCDSLMYLLWNYTTGDKFHFVLLERVVAANIAKLTDRQARGLIRGSGHGDDRR